MKTTNPSSEVLRLCKAKGNHYLKDDVDKIMKAYNEILYDKLVNGEHLRIPKIGKISTSISRGVSRLTKENIEYETIKFKFTPASELKKQIKEKLTEIQEKHL